MPSARCCWRISHELRSPLTRARLNAELVPDTPETLPERNALLRDLNEMRDLISDLLESERLASPHAALHREPVDLAALVREVAGRASRGRRAPCSTCRPTCPRCRSTARA